MVEIFATTRYNLYMKKIVLIGCGNMGSAMATRLLNNDLTIVTTKRSLETLKSKFPSAKIADASEYCDVTGAVVILSVKPQKIDSVKISGHAKSIVSIMAGIPLEKLKSKFEAKAYIRAMPNLAAEFEKSATAYTGDIAAKDDAKEILEKIGRAVWLGSEKELDIATALAGSGPAFLALAAEAMMDGGVRLGLSREASTELTSALFDGFASLLANEHPALLKDRVMSPGGTTAAGYTHLEDSGVRSAYIGALKAAFDRAQELK